MSVLSKPWFHDEEEAFKFLEAELWPNGATCPHCGGMDRIVKIKANPTKRVRYGLHQCGDCKKQFTVKVGTVFEHARIPLFKMLQAVHLLCSSKKGISSHQLHRILEVQYKTAWFLSHRIREAFRSGDLKPMGGLGTHVEADETFIGRYEGAPKTGGHGIQYKNVVMTLVERGGEARSFHIAGTSRHDVEKIVLDNVKREATLMTDEANHYTAVGKAFLDHQTVHHRSEEYARGIVHTNTVEGFYSIFKRGMKGVYQHCSEKHLHRYLAEFDFRYTHRIACGVDDKARTSKALRGVVGKRLTYRRTGEYA